MTEWSRFWNSRRGKSLRIWRCQQKDTEMRATLYLTPINYDSRLARTQLNGVVNEKFHTNNCILVDQNIQIICYLENSDLELHNLEFLD